MPFAFDTMGEPSNSAKTAAKIMGLHKSKLTPRDEQKQLNLKSPAKELAKELEASGTKLYIAAYKKLLHCHGLKGCLVRKKPLRPLKKSQTKVCRCSVLEEDSVS